MRRRPCEQCGSDLSVTARAHARFCSGACRARAQRNSIPSQLRGLDRWVTHSPSKVPLTPRGRPASSTDPRTWSPYSAIEPLPRRGFVLDGDGIVCLDLDHCLVNGVLTARGREILARCPATYVEVSQSGTGLHVWGRGQVERGRRLAGVECYGTGRFIAVTGVRFGRRPSTLADLSEVLAWLLT